MFALVAFIHFFAAYVMAVFANWIGLYSWRRSSTAHWTERARLLWPVRSSAVSNIFVIPLLLDQAHRLFSPETVYVWELNGIAAFFGAVLGSYPFDRIIFPQLNFKLWCRHAVISWSFRLGIWIALIAAGVLMPQQFGWEMAAVLGCYLVLHFAIQYGLMLKYLRWAKLLKPASQRLQRIVDEASVGTGAHVHATWLLETVSAQAFAFPSTNELLFTEPLLEICDDAEVSAICTHELAHLSESKLTLAGRLLGSLSMLPFIFILPMVHLLGAGGLLVVLAAFFSLQRFSKWLSQKMEKRADETAIVRQLNEGAYASALYKLYFQNQIPAVNVNDRQTHPHLYDRLIAAGITPDFERPSKPKKTTWVGTIYAGALGVLFAMVLIHGRLM